MARVSRNARWPSAAPPRGCVSASHWAPLHEVSLPNGRRADILALRGDGGFVCIEVKSGLRDFLTDQKWWEYREFADHLFFAVDLDFPLDVLPPETGLIVVADQTRRTDPRGAGTQTPRHAPDRAAAALGVAGRQPAGDSGGPRRSRGPASIAPRRIGRVAR